MKIFWYSFATSCITALCFLYFYEVKRPVDREFNEQSLDLRTDWMDFINANIRASFTKYHCHQCSKMIELFNARFRKETPPYIFNEWINQLYNRLDSRYKNICTEDDRLSNITSDDAINLIA